jgi:hypothetical protein
LNLNGWMGLNGWQWMFTIEAAPARAVLARGHDSAPERPIEGPAAAR